jgi:putative hydrolase of the HAD superfamily
VPLLLADLDDTALDRSAAFDVWAKGFLEDRALPTSALEWLRKEDRNGRRDKTELFTVVRDQFGLNNDVDALVRGFRAAFPACFELSEAVADGLRRLRAAGWRIALVTNGSSDQQRKIDASGLSAHVDGVAISEVVGARKPARLIFEAAAAAAGASVENAWIAGDDPQADIGGAVNLARPSIWITRGRPWQRDDFAPTKTARTFADALGLLRDVE